MGKGYKHGGAGAGVSFRVKTYSTQEILAAATPADNTLGIVTDVPVSGWTISSTAPDNPEYGHLWIRNGSSSMGSLNALRSNTILLCPVAAQQYTDAGWTDRPGATFLDGSWKEWGPNDVYLFRAGDQNVELTGGWSGISLTASIIKMSESSEQWGGGGATVASSTNKAVDLTQFAALRICVDSYYQDFSVIFTDIDGEKTAEKNASSPGTMLIDLTNISGAHYITLQAYSYASDGASMSVNFKVSEVQLLAADSVQMMESALTVLGVDV